MINFVIGTVFGIVISTVGFTGIAPMLDGAVQSVQKTTIENVKPQLPKR
jgi:hypothetical protein